MAITADQAAHIRTLLDEGTTQRQVAITTGVSKGRIAALVRRGFVVSERIPKNAISFHGEPVRCSGCGGKVWMPCVVCEMENAKITAKARLNELLDLLMK